MARKRAASEVESAQLNKEIGDLLNGTTLVQTEAAAAA
jgi:hypothetical protein